MGNEDYKVLLSNYDPNILIKFSEVYGKSAEEMLKEFFNEKKAHYDEKSFVYYCKRCLKNLEVIRESAKEIIDNKNFLDSIIMIGPSRCGKTIVGNALKDETGMSQVELDNRNLSAYKELKLIEAEREKQLFLETYGKTPIQILKDYLVQCDEQTLLEVFGITPNQFAEEYNDKTFIEIYGRTPIDVLEDIAKRYEKTPNEKIEEYKVQRNKCKLPREEGNMLLILNTLRDLKEPSIVSFGAGHSHFENPIFTLELMSLFDNCKGTVMLLPNETDKVESLRILNDGVSKRGNGNFEEQKKDNEKFINSKSNYALANLIVSTGEFSYNNETRNGQAQEAANVIKSKLNINNKGLKSVNY